jgi:hypothetical protein
LGKEKKKRERKEENSSFAGMAKPITRLLSLKRWRAWP